MFLVSFEIKMKSYSFLKIFAMLGLFIGFLQANEMQADQTIDCPIGYNKVNGLCYLSSQYTPAANCNTATTESVTAENSTIHTNDELSTESISSTERMPEAQIRCPLGSIFLNAKCRKIICPLGEFIAGRCLKVTCPPGLVWREQSCQEPEYLTTILEIENVFRSEAHASHGNVTRVNINNINNNTFTNTEPIIMPTTPTTTTTIAPIITKRPKQTTTTTTTQRPPAPLVRPECCTVHSPRLCKNYQKKWVCFNHPRKFCDRKICAFPTMYLKTPKIVYKESLLVMPPHPPLKACRERGCDSTNTVDCSGCVSGERESCSPFCYYYYCPEDTCGYMDLQDFCQIYPKHPFGCNRDNCLWGWCGGDRSQ